MDRASFHAALKSESEALRTAAPGNLAVPVPTCPGWAIGDLVRHLGEVYEFFTDVVSTGAIDSSALHEKHQTMRAERDEAFAQSDRLLDWYRDRTDALLAALRSRSVDARVWTWWEPVQSVGWYDRRMAHETAVHRWDVEHALGDAVPIDPELSVDGIDEALSMHAVDRRPDSELPGRNELFRFRTTDIPGQWDVFFPEAGGVEVTSTDEQKAGVAVAGPASDILLYLWQRSPADSLSVVGNRQFLDRWFDLIPPD
ncbi:MAG: maleylpyruvate isomerase family mycothiol-dependent enzyme [Chloroflexota bacterium]